MKLCKQCKKEVKAPFYCLIKPTNRGPWCIECGWSLIKDDKAKLLHA